MHYFPLSVLSVAFKNRAALIVRTATASPRHGRAALPRSSTRLTFAEKQSHVQYDNRNMTLVFKYFRVLSEHCTFSSSESARAASTQLVRM